MSYFGSEFTRFFRGLARHNTRAWYQARRDDFVRSLKEPFEEFVGEMIERVAALDPAMRCEPREAIFRLARDTRFSRDKTPYKTHLGAVLAPDGRKTRAAAFYFQLGADGVGVATGVYQPDRAQLYAIREAIRDDGPTLDRMLRHRTFRRWWGELQGERNVRLPSEFAAAATRQPLLYHKQFYAWVEHGDPATIERPDLAEFLMRHYRAGRAVTAWLTRALARA